MNQGSGIGGVNGANFAGITPEANTLNILLSAIYEFNFSNESKRLKRSPLILAGGFEAWSKEIGDKGIGMLTAAPSASGPTPITKESEYQA